VCVCVCILCVCMSIGVYVCLCMCVYAYVCVYVCVCVCKTKLSPMYTKCFQDCVLFLRGMVTRSKYAYSSSCSVCYVCLFVTKTEMGRKFVVKSPNIKCNENLISASRIHAKRQAKNSFFRRSA
jgi:hypothetical protein